MAIQSFSAAGTRRLFEDGICPSQFRTFKAVADRKLDMLDAATTLTDLRNPPGNRLETLRGNRRGQHSTRINDQWRICFRWTPEGPADVEIVEYH